MAEAKPSTGKIYVGPVDDRNLSYVVSGLTPTKLSAALRDADLGIIRDFMELCEEMEDRDGQISQCLATRKAAVVACDYDVEPYRDYSAIQGKRPAESKDVEVADFVRDVLFSLSCWEDRKLDLLDAISKGVAFQEIGWRKGGRYAYTIDDLVWVPQRTMTYKDSDEPRLLTADNTTEGVPLTRYGWVVHSPRTRSIEPWRAGLMRVLSWWFVFKHFNLSNWMVFLETHAHPLRLGFHAPNASQEQKEAMWAALRYASRDQAALVEKTNDAWDPIKIQYPETRSATGSFGDLNAVADKEIAKVVLGQTLTSDADGKGSYALGAIHNKVRNVYLAADADALATTIRRDIIYPLVLFNFGAEQARRLPWYRIYYQEPEDLLAKANQWGVLSTQVGVRFSDAQAREVFGLDEVQGDGDSVGMPSTSPDAPPPDTPPVPDEAQATAQMAGDDRPTGAPEVVIPKTIDIDLPAPVKSTMKEYAAVVDGFNKAAVNNTMERVTKYLIRADGGWPSGEAFASEFTKWWDKAWVQYWGDEGIAQGSLYPFLERMYSYYKTTDFSAFPAGYKFEGSFGVMDERVVGYMERADRWYFSKFTQNDSFRGPMQQFLLDEYAERGGALFGPKNARVIQGFKKAAVKTTHELSRYEVDRIIRTGVNRSRCWANLSQLNDAGIERYEIVTAPGECDYCRALEGQTVDVASEMSWVESALSMSDEQFRQALDDRVSAHRAGVKAGLDPQQFIGSVHAPPFHPNCRCRLVGDFSD